ncbi:Inosine/uridine-preferring nucleoside hydrolase [Fimbriimonas ginsengisoli Gsoil 348]|uniref:Inosine/uridine-preferring nucleoside hydrolase n=1 Tax=Fimbriimonas ginsengisoli Gsoil 348 TaxID=661478 RepID=A0A068NTW1_FIMGI|nr:Inosine/uridine-preferring nucleoside hydrolase [Fimbriimonas ginsengisoli Gsoil 348]
MDRIPILLDTDPGSDIDDALALAYLLREPRCELIGVTTVTGDVAKRAAIVEIICGAFGREDVPIHCGASDTLAGGPGQPRVPQYDAIAHLPHRMDRPQNTAVDYLRETIRSRPGEITLLSIGPFTNLAILFALDPEIPKLLKGLISMGGCFDRPGCEWNALCDPYATVATIMRSARQTWVGLDVTMQCQMAPEEVRAKFAKPPLDVLLLMAERWFQDANKITFHDPLAAAVIFHPELCRYSDGLVVARMTEDGLRTEFTPGMGGHRIATEVDVAPFFEEYFGVF